MSHVNHLVRFRGNFQSDLDESINIKTVQFQGDRNMCLINWLEHREELKMVSLPLSLKRITSYASNVAMEFRKNAFGSELMKIKLLLKQLKEMLQLRIGSVKTQPWGYYRHKLYDSSLLGVQQVLDLQSQPRWPYCPLLHKASRSMCVIGYKYAMDPATHKMEGLHIQWVRQI